MNAASIASIVGQVATEGDAIGDSNGLSGATASGDGAGVVMADGEPRGVSLSEGTSSHSATKALTIPATQDAFSNNDRSIQYCFKEANVPGQPRAAAAGC